MGFWRIFRFIKYQDTKQVQGPCNETNSRASGSIENDESERDLPINANLEQKFQDKGKSNSDKIDLDTSIDAKIIILNKSSENPSIEKNITDKELSVDTKSTLNKLNSMAKQELECNDILTLEIASKDNNLSVDSEDPSIEKDITVKELTVDAKSTTNKCILDETSCYQNGSQVNEETKSPVCANKMMYDDGDENIVNISSDDSDIILISSDEDDEVKHLTEEKSDDETGYNSSDFEFITEAEAEGCAFIRKNEKFQNIPLDAGSIRQNIENEANTSKVDTANKDENIISVHNYDFSIVNNNNVPYMDIVPVEHTQHDSEILEGNLDPLPHQNLFMEQKAITFGPNLAMHPVPERYQMGFDMQALLNQINHQPVDDESLREAETTKRMILNLYPQDERKTRKRRRRF